MNKALIGKSFDKFEAFHNEIDAHANIKHYPIAQRAYELNSEGIYQEIDVIAYFLFDENKAVESAEEGYFKLQCLPLNSRKTTRFVFGRCICTN